MEKELSSPFTAVSPFTPVGEPPFAPSRRIDLPDLVEPEKTDAMVAVVSAIQPEIAKRVLAASGATLFGATLLFLTFGQETTMPKEEALKPASQASPAPVASLSTGIIEATGVAEEARFALPIAPEVASRTTSASIEMIGAYK